ncbi:MAG: GTP-binding protein, partial [Rhodospirillales bacterium]|nr:GTP-binding protein [Rhodospirillales bacterium]
IDGRWSHHDAEDDHDHDDFESFVLTMGDIADPEELEERIKACAVDHDILRVKGFVHVLGKDMRHVVQAVGARVQRYYDRPWADGEARRTELVIIGEAGLDQAAIGRALAGN